MWVLIRGSFKSSTLPHKNHNSPDFMGSVNEVTSLSPISEVLLPGWHEASFVCSRSHGWFADFKSLLLCQIDWF